MHKCNNESSISVNDSVSENSRNIKFCHFEIIRCIFIILGAVFLVYQNVSAEFPVSFTGYVKNFLVLYRYHDRDFALVAGLPSRTDFGAVNQRIRLVSEYSPTKRAKLSAAYDWSLRIQDRALYQTSPFLTISNPLDYRIEDPDRQMYPRQNDEQGSFGIFQNLDRLQLHIALPVADLYMGRQAIAWGSARIINPTDVLAPFAYDDLDTEDRIGIDAVRWRMPLGMLGEFDTGYVFGKNWKFSSSAFFVRSKILLWRSDISVIMLGFRENLLAGFDMTRAIGGAGFWMEGAYVFSDLLSKEIRNSDMDYLRISTGMDYSFTGKLYGFMEYHFNQAGEDDAGNYHTNFSKTAYREGSVYLLGKHYLTPGVTYQLTPLVILTGQSLFNILDPSLYLAMSAEYNIAQNIYLSGGMFFGAGRESENFNLHSEFGSYPNTWYTSFRIYF